MKNIGLKGSEKKLWRNGLTFALKEHPEIARLGLTTWSGNIGMMKLSEKLGLNLKVEFVS